MRTEITRSAGSAKSRAGVAPPHTDDAVYRRLFEAVDTGVVIGELVRDADGRVREARFLETNPAYDAIGGEAVGRGGIADPRWIERIETLVDAGVSDHVTHREGDGSAVHDWLIIPLGGDRFAGFITDVTEREQVFAELQESRGRLRLALDAAQMGTFIWHAAEDRTEPDPRMLELFGLPPDGILSLETALTSMIHPDDRERYVEAVMRALDPSGPRALREDIRVRQADGSERWIAVTGLVEFDGERPVRMAGAAADVSQQKRTEIVLRERDARLLANEVELRAALAVKDEFLGLVSHELRTPMTVVLGMSEMLARPDVTLDRVHQIAPDIAESAEVLHGLVESMLTLARLDREEATTLREPMLLRRAVAAIIVRRAAKDPTRDYRLEADEHATLVEVKPEWLDAVVDNLIGNAAKYSTAGRPILVTIEASETEVTARVLDEGPGLSDEDLVRVFEPFYRSKAAREQAPGSGLGLVVAKRIIELMGGRIWALHREGGGTEFGFAVPAMTEPGS